MTAQPDAQEPQKPSHNSYQRRGKLEPIWGRLQEHDHDIRELYKNTARAHERLNATDELVLYLREDIRQLSQQSHKDSRMIVEELRKANNRMAVAETRTAEILGRSKGRWETLKVGVPIVIAAAGLVLSGIMALSKLGLLG